jgi:glycosyltransferase involved in cell wall biosynthesis
LQNTDDPNDEDFVVSKYQRYLIASNRTNLTDTLFTGDSSAWDVSMLQSVQDADLINLHWVSEFINTESLQLLSELGKPIVWTLHDERAFTGGCHYTFGCMNYSESCSSCPQVIEGLSWLPKFNLNARNKLREIPLMFICPSQWIQSKLHQSKVFNEKSHHSQVIPYSIDLNTFKPIETKAISSLKKELNIEQDSICLLAGSFSLDDDRKGGAFIVDALKGLTSLLKSRKLSRKVVLLTYGKGTIPIDSIETKHLGFIQSETQIARVLNVADLFLSMTREDNLPNTIMESLACGTPVISTDVGGISDMVTDNYNGRLIQRDNSQQMADAILRSIEDKKLLPKWSANARVSAELNFSHQKQGSEYIKVFNRLLAENSFQEPAKRLSPRKIITNSAKQIPALNSFPSKDYRGKALNWFEKHSSDEG